MKLDNLTDAEHELQTVINDATELLKQRDAQRKETALEKARELLAAAGLTLKDLTTKRVAKKAPTTFKPKTYHVYQHPDNQALKANGTGVKPSVECPDCVR